MNESYLPNFVIHFMLLVVATKMRIAGSSVATTEKKGCVKDTGGIGILMIREVHPMSILLY